MPKPTDTNLLLPPCVLSAARVNKSLLRIWRWRHVGVSTRSDGVEGIGDIESDFGIRVRHDVCKSSDGASGLLTESSEGPRTACSRKPTLALQAGDESGNAKLGRHFEVAQNASCFERDIMIVCIFKATDDGSNWILGGGLVLLHEPDGVKGLPSVAVWVLDHGREGRQRVCSKPGQAIGGPVKTRHSAPRINRCAQIVHHPAQFLEFRSRPCPQDPESLACSASKDLTLDGVDTSAHSHSEVVASFAD